MFSNVRTLDRRHRHRAAIGKENVLKTLAEYVLEELKKIAKKIGTMQEDLAATHTESWEVVEKAKVQEDLKKFIEGVRTVQDTVAAVHTQCEGRGEEMGVLLRTFVEIGQSSVDIMSSSHDTMLSMHAKERENPRENLRNILQEEKREKAKLARVDRRSRILKIKMHNMQKASEVMEGRQVLLEPIMVLQHQRRALRARHVHWVRVQWDPLSAYKIGGHSISANTIEHSILSFRTYRPAQWLETLLSTGARIKAGDERRTFGRKYGLEDPEPLVLFALCRGGHSDPAVRIYTAKNVYDELETAKREFLQASIGIQNQRRVFLPRILERYSKEASITSANLLNWVSENVDKQLKTAIKKCIERKPQAKAAQCIEWLQYNGSFRYIFARDLMAGLV